MPKVEVRLVESKAEREALYAFRFGVYVEELEMTDQADHARRWLHDGYDKESLNYALFAGGEVVGSLRCILLDRVSDPGPLIDKFDMEPAIDAFGMSSIMTTSRFMLAPKLRNTMAVFRLMRMAFFDAVRQGIRLNYGDCSPHLLPFYEHLGYRRYTSGYNDTAFGYKLPILMLVRDRAFLEAVRSPLVKLLEPGGDDAEAREWFAATYPHYVELVSAVLMPEEMFFDVLAERVAGNPLHSMSLLQGLTREEAQRFLREATVVDLNPGDRIVRKGERDNALFMLLSGAAEVREDKRPDPPIVVLGAGDTFGAEGYLTTVPRTADVVAVTPGEAIVLSGEFMDRFIAREPAIGARVMHNLARQLASQLVVTTQRALPPWGTLSG
jgi:hypothetical protein